MSVIRPEKTTAVYGLVAKLKSHETRYRKVSEQAGVPWGFVAAVHTMEAGLDFARHLHNGDPLTGRTVHVPAGRPKKGDPPFIWEESAS